MVDVKNIGTLFIFFLLAICWSCSVDASDSFGNDSVPSSSSISNDTIEYIKPPELSCKEILALREYDQDNKPFWDYYYDIRYYVFLDNKILGFNKHNTVYYIDYGKDSVWTKTTNLFGDSSGVVTDHEPNLIDSILIVTRKLAENYQVCRTVEFFDNWVCTSFGTDEINVINDGMYFYLETKDQLKYSSDGISWIPLDVSIKHLKNGFMKDSTHFIFSSWGNLYWSNNLVHWDSTSIPIEQSGRKVVYGNGVFVYAGPWGELLYSTDLKKWSPASKGGGSPWLEDLIFANGFFIAVGTASSMGNTKIVLTSYNGKDFKSQTYCGETDRCTSISYDGHEKFYIRNDSGMEIYQLVK